MTKVDIVSGFLGAGKTTLIKKLIKDALAGTRVVLIENEFGEIGIDGGFLKEAGIEIREMNSGCICCSLVGDFNASLKQVMETYQPERILIEPSGVGKLDDVMRAIEKTAEEIPDMKVGSAVTVVDAAKARVYFKNFGEFFVNQIENAGTVLLTRTDKVSQEKIDEAVALIREHNQKATIITTPLAELDGKKVLETIEGGEDLQSEILAEVMAAEEEHHHHHHHHDEHAEKFTDEDGNTVYCAHHHHDHDEDHEEEEHEHHCCHDHEQEEHEHHCCHDHEHDADEVFESWGMETPQKYSAEEVERMLEALEDADTYGFVLRSKGMLPSADGTWVHFDYVPGEPQVRTGAADVTGKICVIGSGLHQDNLEKLFKRRNGNGQ
ncbi:MAG: GTP-binding protein [Firmicutes bacterium]|nr:GTP-binding protein [Bacillota bacterium]